MKDIKFTRINFLAGFREDSIIYLFEKNGDNAYLITIMRVGILNDQLTIDYNNHSFDKQFENYINKQFYNGFTFYAKTKSKLTKAEKQQSEMCIDEFEVTLYNKNLNHTHFVRRT